MMTIRFLKRRAFNVGTELLVSCQTKSFLELFDNKMTAFVIDSCIYLLMLSRIG